MQSFIDYLLEKQLNIGNKSSYPRFNNILVLAGGAGSGKGFAYSNIIGFEGKKFDVDEIKSNMLKYKPKQLSDMFLKQTGRELSSIDLKNSTDVTILHQFVSDNKIDDKFIENFLAAQAKLKNKPNIIFDVTLKNTKKLQEISDYVTAVGYDKSNIHVVWIMNKFEVAYQQNKQRARSVSDEIMFTTHTGASLTMKELVENSKKWSKVANGDYWILFNQAEVDNELLQTDKDEEGNFSKDGTIYKDRVINPDGTLGKEITHRRKNFIVKRYDAIKIKSRNKVANMADIESTIIDKINSYAPSDGKQW